MRSVLALCLLLLAGLAWLGDGRGMPEVAPGEESRWEGQRARVSGWVEQVQASSDGAQRFLLEQAGHAIPVRLRGGPAPAPGAWASAEGSIARQAGLLTLLADDAHTSTPPVASTVALADLAAAPQDWVGRAAQLEGTISGHTLRDAAGHAVSLGDGPWPHEGQVAVAGHLRYDEACLCHRFDALSVGPA